MSDHDDLVARTIASLGLVGIAWIHIVELPDTIREQAYVGWLFIGAIVASLLLVSILTRTNDMRAWALTGGLAGLVLIAFLFSRVTGLPGFTEYKGVWDDGNGLVSMIADGLVVLVSGAVLATRSPAFARQRTKMMESGGREGMPGHTALG